MCRFPSLSIFTLFLICLYVCLFVWKKDAVVPCLQVAQFNSCMYSSNSDPFFQKWKFSSLDRWANFRNVWTNLEKVKEWVAKIPQKKIYLQIWPTYIFILAKEQHSSTVSLLFLNKDHWIFPTHSLTYWRAQFLTDFYAIGFIGK